MRLARHVTSRSRAVGFSPTRSKNPNSPCALGNARHCPPCSWASQHRTPPSQLELTRMLAVGLHVRLEMPSFPADWTGWSVGAAMVLAPAAGAGDPKAAMMRWFLVFALVSVCVGIVVDLRVGRRRRYGGLSGCSAHLVSEFCEGRTDEKS